MILYSIYFTHNGQVVRLPHNPSELPDTQETENGEYNVLGLGPISVPRLPGQRKISISDYLPGNFTKGLLGALTTVPPETYINFFREAMASGDPILYTPVRIDETGLPYAMSLQGYYVLVDRFDFREKGGETGDFYYELECTEYRDYTPGRMQVAASASTATPASPAAVSLSRARMAAVSTVQTSPAESTSNDGALRATVEPTRLVGPQQLVVGSRCALSGSYWMSSERGAPETPASGLQCIVSRICGSDIESPVYIKGANGEPIGWTKKSMLTIQPGNTRQRLGG